MKERCGVAFPDEKSVTTKNTAYGTEPITYETYKQNPKRVKCEMMARAKTLKDFIKWVSTEKSENICKHNIEKKQPACIRIIERMKKEGIKELRELSRILSQTSEKKPMTKQEFQKVAGALTVNINVNK